MRNVVITGGLGLLGKRISASFARGCLETGSSVRFLVVDQASDAGLERSTHHVVEHNHQLDSILAGQVSSSGPQRKPRMWVSYVRGDLANAEVLTTIQSFVAAPPSWTSNADDGDVDPELSIFHLASVMSGQGEADFDRALNVNVDACRSLIDVCRETSVRPRFLFASSIAAFGGGPNVSDDNKLLPETTYGMTKACAELLVNDCTRKGFIDGRIARLPTVVVRPGPPNPAATGCFSSVPKAVLHGQDFVSPVSPDLQHPCIALSDAVEGIIRLHDAPESDLGTRDRAVTLPAVSLTLRDLEESASKLAKHLGRSPGRVTYKPDAAVEAVVAAMPSAVTTSEKARRLGLRVDVTADKMVNEYANDTSL